MSERPKPGTPVPAEIIYEVQIVPGPFEVEIAGSWHKITSRDATVIKRITRSAGKRFEEAIVAVVTNTVEMLNLRAFILGGGAMDLHRDMKP